MKTQIELDIVNPIMNLNFLMFFTALFYLSNAIGQVRLVQWTDVHSTIETLPDQLNKIDVLAHEFYEQNPTGEFIVYLIGDFISLNPFSREDNGKISLDAVGYLRARGYTVLYTPGNHDAFDWSGKVNPMELFLEHLKVLHSMGVIVLAKNIDKPKLPLKDLLTDYYLLKTINAPSALVGFIIENLFKKSSIDKEMVQPYFKGITKYEIALEKVIHTFEKKGIQNVVLGIHHGHKRLKKFVHRTSEYARSQNISIPLVMAADDHIVASYYEGPTLISDAGSHGSMSYIDLPKNLSSAKELKLYHWPRNAESADQIDKSIFRFGDVVTTRIYESTNLMFIAFKNRLNLFVEQIKSRLNRVIAITEGIYEHKQDLKKGRTPWGDVLAETLSLWAASKGYLSTAVLPIFSFVNSSSYRLESNIPAGEITEYTVREMYPFLCEATLYRLNGKEIETLFFSLKKHYQDEDPDRYTPQMSSHLRERRNRIEFFDGVRWTRLDHKTTYLLAIDGWLSEHRFGLGSKIKEWVEILQRHRPLASEEFQDILVKELAQALRNYKPRTHPSAELTQRSCRQLF